MESDTVGTDYASASIVERFESCSRTLNSCESDFFGHSRALIELEKRRLERWAEDIKLSSLRSRLQKTPDVADAILILLEDVLARLNGARRIGISPSHAPNTVDLKPQGLNVAPDWLASSNSSEQLVRIDQDRVHDLRVATKTINELYKFVDIVPADDIMQNTLSQAMTWHVLDQYGLEIDSDLEDVVCGEIGRWIPDHNPKVVKRISEAICLRIRDFQCTAFYSRRGCGQPAGDLKPSSCTTLSHGRRLTDQYTSSSSASRPGIEALVTDGSAMPNSSRGKKDLSMNNAANPLDIDQLGEKINELLTPPKQEAAASICVCQYCGSQLSDPPPTLSKWRVHVLRDLRPYVCIFEECKYPNELFATVEDWMDHLDKPHISKWVCPAHSTAPEPARFPDWGFDSADGFKAHLEQFHGTIMSESRVSMLLKACHLHVRSRPPWPACNLKFQSSFHGGEKTFHGDNYFYNIADELLALAMTFPPWDSLSREFKKRPVMEEFFYWINQTSSFGQLDMFSEKDVRFVPKDAMDQYFGDRRILERLLEQHSFTDEHILPIVFDQYSKTFAILLVIRKGYLIADFVQQDKIDDSALPLKTRPPGFPDPFYAPDIFPEFYEAQWQFCSPVLSYQQDDLCFSSDCILPVVRKNQVASVDGATLHEAWIHEAHGPNSLKGNFGEPRHTSANTVYIKTYRSKDAESYYWNEVRAFRMLQSLSLDKKSGLIEFYGNFIHGSTQNILLEFADFGVLEHYFQSFSAPRTFEQVKSFWNGMLGLLSALECIHDTAELQEFQRAEGWFPDIRPGNILVFNGSDSIYPYRFKLSHLGLSQFKQQSFQWTQKYADEIHRAEIYYSPEFHRSTSYHKGSLVRRRKADVWSLGCVFSEALSWTAFGPDGLGHLRSIRRDETRRLSNSTDIGCFHDGFTVLKAVLDYQEHAALNKWELMLIEIHHLIRKMLSHADDRPSSADLLANTNALLRKEEKASLAATRAMELRYSASGSSHASHSPRVLTESSISSTQTLLPSSTHSSSTSLIPKSRPNQAIAIEKGRSIQDSIPRLLEADEPTDIPHHSTRPAGNASSNATAEQLAPKTAKAEKPRPAKHGLTLDFLEASTQISLSSPKRWPWVKAEDFFDQRLPEIQLNRLKGRSHVFIIDISTENQWGKVEDLLNVLTHIIKKAKPTSTSFHFPSAHEMKAAEKRLRAAGVKTKVTYAVDNRQDISERLIDVAEAEYFQPLTTRRDRPVSRRIRRGQKKSTATSLYVLSDWPWGSDDHLKSTLEAFAERLNSLDIGANDFGIQFICLKDDQALMSRAQSLAEDVNRKRHIVDVEYWTRNVWKMIFGSFTPKFDEGFA